ncbi:MAG: ABC transporter ATP-binding protein [Alistipes sp.]
MERRCVITGERLSIGYRLGGRGVRRVHEGLSFSLRAGELTCLLGPNGAGKSTLLKTLGGGRTLLDGELRLCGEPFGKYSETRRSRLVGVVLTDKVYAGGLRVHQLVALGRYPYTGFFGNLGAEDRRVVDWAMEAVGIAGKAGSYVAELSDGERQKAMIAKALAQQCPVILLDEPTAFLDIISRIEVMNLLYRLAREEHKAVLLSTHDVDQALLLADSLWLMSQQNGLLCGTTEDLVLNGSLNRFSAGATWNSIRTTAVFGIAAGWGGPCPSKLPTTGCYCGPGMR